ncbi:two pore channel protein 1-like [Littorina saxatilis]|uniref:two pore channel protein 1-like n=1 Tax=Littorina saxatilis TaxID=31220 RepID=UPI0038B6086A
MASSLDSPLLIRNERTRTLSINDPENDHANTVGNIALEIPDPRDCVSPLRSETNRRKLWQLNYQEAAIFLQEGSDNDKFKTHPRSHEALPAYEVAHNHWFHLLDLVASISIMLLAVCERPAIDFFSLPVGVHGSLELLCLLLLSLELFIRYKWLGLHTFLRHKRTMVKVGMLFLMVTESIIVLVRQTNHFRVTRALRPVFLIHSHYCKGMRRIARQILLSLPPILDMIILLLFFMLIFSILGFYLFSPIPQDPYFKTIQDSFINLFILLTTANYPDVMMPAYAVSRFYAFFFIIYLSLELYFLMNLLLAVVYDTFSNLEKSKLRSLFLHKREACSHAFRLLVTTKNNQKLSLRHFVGMMHFFDPRKSRRDCYLMFKSLNISCSGGLSMEEFFAIYDVAGLQWSLKDDNDRLWSSNFRHPCNKIFKAIHWFVTWRYFDYFVYVTIAGNFVWILQETIRISVKAIDVVSYDFTASWISIVFVCLYSVESMLKILGRGPKDYFTHGWDVFDFLVTVVSVIGVFGELFDDSFYFILVLRPFRLLRLFKIKRRYRDVLGTLFVLFQRLMSLIIVIVLVYYFFAIIGMEIFLGKDLRNCCKNTSVEDFYKYDNTSTQTGFYYLNNFDNLLVSGVTLFELTVVNNWFIIMGGYAKAVSEWTRIYFMLFYIVMMVVMNIVVAFVLESFMFRIQYRRQMAVEDIEADHGTQKVEVTLNEEELNMCKSQSAPLTGTYIAQQSQTKYLFRGERSRNREDFSLRMYHDEVRVWAEEFNTTRMKTVESLDQMRIRNRPNSHRGDSLDDIHAPMFEFQSTLQIDHSPGLSPDF